MITGKLLSSSKNLYSRVLGNSLISSFGGDFNDGLSFFSDGVNYLILDFHLLISMDDDVTSKEKDKDELSILVKNHY